MCRKVVGKYIRVHMLKSAWRSSNRAAGEGDMIGINYFTGASTMSVRRHMCIDAGMKKNIV